MRNWPGFAAPASSRRVLWALPHCKIAAGTAAPQKAKTRSAIGNFELTVTAALRFGFFSKRSVD
jgi:hypothetical protein